MALDSGIGSETLTVDMIVAVHDLKRDIRRAVSSILVDADASIRVFIVCHNLPKADVQNALRALLEANPGRVRIEELNDGVPSPSGPFMFGMTESDAHFVGIMGSDDELDPGAIAAWRRTAIRRNADAVIAKVVRGTQRTLVRSPPKRLMRTGVLDFARDRLSYRSAPLGLMRREAIARLDLRLLDGARNGGDLPFVTRLWFTGRVVAAEGLAAYVEHADAPVRVTHVAKPVREELWPVLETLRDEVVLQMGRGARTALATKLLRRNLTDSIRKRDSGRVFTPDDCDAMREIIEAIDEFAPGARFLLARAHARMFDELASADPDLARVADADNAALRYRSTDALLPARLRHALHPQGQPRFTAATALIKVGASRYFSIVRAVALSGVALIIASVAYAVLSKAR